VTIWFVTLVAYVGSVAANVIFLNFGSSPAVAFIGGITLFVLGPTVAALLFGRPPLLLLATLVPLYYVFVALSVSDYDEPRWGYGRFWTGVFMVLVQSTAAAIAAAAARPRRMHT
jgi:hypothetical protein